jgi:hypothetical protein
VGIGVDILVHRVVKIKQNIPDSNICIGLDTKNCKRNAKKIPIAILALSNKYKQGIDHFSYQHTRYEVVSWDSMQAVVPS